MSQTAPRGCPRWSTESAAPAFDGSVHAPPAAGAGPPAPSAIVFVGPPLPASAARSGSAPTTSPSAVASPHCEVDSRLWPPSDVTAAGEQLLSAGALPEAMIVFAAVNGEPFVCTLPPRPPEEFAASVTLASVTPVGAPSSSPPPSPAPAAPFVEPGLVPCPPAPSEA